MSIPTLEECGHSLTSLEYSETINGVPMYICGICTFLNRPLRQCPYSFSHTGHWCGYVECRNS